MLTRRQILIRSLALSGGAAPGILAAAPASSSRFTKSICSVIFPEGMPLADRFPLVKNAGFEGIEIRLGDDIPLSATPEDAKRARDAAHAAGISIVSLWVSQPLSANPLNSPDPEVRARGSAAVRKAIDLATYLDCGALLLYPGRVGNGPKFGVSYEDTWQRFTSEFQKLLPVAEQAKVLLTPENVWNKFLLSPLEMRSFVDQFKSPWLQTHFDIGNVMQFGYPQDWILTLGSRIKRVHVKDYKLSARAEQGRFVGLLEGDVDWKAVMKALVTVGYRGYLSPEIGYDPNVPDQLRKVSSQLDQILAMA